METELLRYELESASFDLFMAYPEEVKPAPAVLVCHAWGGRDAFAESKAQALAELGYVGAAIDLYGVNKRGQDKQTCSALMNELFERPYQFRDRLRVAFELVAGHERVNTDRVGAIGYCMGGLASLLLARLGLPLKAAVSFHGLLKLGEPLDTKPTARMLILHGQDDPMVPPEDISSFAREMQRVDGDWILEVYPHAVHSFTNPSANDPDFGTVYNAEADQRSWASMIRFLKDVV
ncbi:MAG: dienelactone hydrolase family protein [Myxococcales bacterium]|nr:dienelactone hydrolase family protein [Myxococcales bacterium]